MPPESATPLGHYERSSLDLSNTVSYFNRKLQDVPKYEASFQKHMARLQSMVFANLVESFERFLKELAGVAINYCAPYVIDDRFDTFKVHSSAIAAHFNAKTIGSALCESLVWLDCDTINKRFKSILADPFEEGHFILFPRPSKKKGQATANDSWRFESLELIWQLRHTIVHNVGVVTQSDATKLRLLVRKNIDPHKVLSPSRDDLRWLRQFLDDTAKWVNKRVATRLADLLTTIHSDNPGILVPQSVAGALATDLGQTVTIANATGVPTT